MDKESEIYRFPEINLIAGCGAEKIMQKIYNSSLGARLLLRSDKFLKREWYRENLVNYLEFFVPEEGFADITEELEGIFFIEVAEWEQEEQQIDSDQRQEESRANSDQEQKESQVNSDQEKKESQVNSDQGQKESQVSTDQEQKESQVSTEQRQEGLQVVLYQKRNERWQMGDKNPRIRLKIIEWPFQIPFELELIPYAGTAVQVEEKILEDSISQEKIIYHMFSKEEYLSRTFYKIVEDLELISLMSWYKDSYDILTTHMVSGRKVSESFGQLLLENSIPLLKERLEIVDSFQDYKYMEKRWENYMGRFWTKPLPLCGSDEIERDDPKWHQVIRLCVRFFTPIFDVALKNELFIGDWMPQIGRYLD